MLCAVQRDDLISAAGRSGIIQALLSMARTVRRDYPLQVRQAQPALTGNSDKVYHKVIALVNLDAYCVVMLFISFKNGDRRGSVLGLLETTGPQWQHNPECQMKGMTPD
jgi:hypothetical protein